MNRKLAMIGIEYGEFNPTTYRRVVLHLENEEKYFTKPADEAIEDARAYATEAGWDVTYLSSTHNFFSDRRILE